MPVSNADDPPILSLENGASIAYHQTQGRAPGVVFLTGFMSDMDGGKALALEELCAARGQAFLRFDYQGHGASSGDFADGHIGAWTEDAVAAFDQLTEGPQILVGSSMGGWIMLLTALARPERVAALIGIAAAPDFTEDILPGELTGAQLAEIETNGRIVIPSEYEDDYIITKALLTEGRKHLVMGGEIPLDCPARLIHGIEDPSVPFETALRLQERLRSDDVEVTLVKAGDHRLSEPEDLARLCRTLESLLDRLS
ncbi:MAG: alpha/beta hydrolase [Rhodospirillales bacterium]|jgi:pimeloyl-ACP methyl ester carboxylesterase|nr:alpha/beta hydrolase [Rhodospirillaceae bacterium]MDP6428407.1 alpha/beta hydrolase [Rhodospirillales bacterium]MDP6642461.1 alpha/beta hydrolase [Rhodospirillales bacterium]MDP6841493.1 alpha/beta hydrolase [Rhodospirillales bacterium]|tara:strand:+ start:643 stop:1410 length:768 start_codon:yes stop_codon:yes gene_type:complete